MASEQAAQPELLAARRGAFGTRPSHRLRQDGLIPAVVYGKAIETTVITVRRHDLLRLLHAGEGERGLLRLRLEADGARGWEKPVLIKEVARDPVYGAIIHVDFQVIVLTEQIKVKVPIVLKGDPVGVREGGGILEHFLRDIEVACLPTAIPSHCEYDVSAMQIGETIHIKDLPVALGVKILSDAEGVVASVLTPKEEKAEEAVEAGAEPEVITEKKPDEKGGEDEGTGEPSKKGEQAPQKGDKPKREEKSKKEDAE